LISKDLFNNIASYKFSEMRFNVRGYDSQYQDVYMNGIQLNDAMTGYTSGTRITALMSRICEPTRTAIFEVSNSGVSNCSE